MKISSNTLKHIAMLEQERLSAIDLASKATKDKLELLGILEEVFNILREDCEPWSDSLRTWMGYKIHMIADENNWNELQRTAYLKKFRD